VQNGESLALVDEPLLPVLSPREVQTRILAALGPETVPEKKTPSFRPMLWQASPEHYRRRMIEIPARELSRMAYESTKDLAGLRISQQKSCGRKTGLTPTRPLKGHGNKERARKYALSLVEAIVRKSTDFREPQVCSTMSSLGSLVEEGLLSVDDDEVIQAVKGLTQQLVTTKNLENMRPIDVLRLSEGLSILHHCLPYDVGPRLAHFLAWMLRVLKDCPQHTLVRLLHVVDRLQISSHPLHRSLALRLIKLKLAPDETRKLACPLVPHLPKCLQKRLTLQLKP